MNDSYYYEYEQDEFYCYNKSHTLKNKLNIIDEEKLKQSEREITALRTVQLMKRPIKGNFYFEHNGYRLDWSKITEDEMLEASI